MGKADFGMGQPSAGNQSAAICCVFAVALTCSMNLAEALEEFQRCAALGDFFVQLIVDGYCLH